MSASDASVTGAWLVAAVLIPVGASLGAAYLGGYLALRGSKEAVVQAHLINRAQRAVDEDVAKWRALLQVYAEFRLNRDAIRVRAHKADIYWIPLQRWALDGLAEHVLAFPLEIQDAVRVAGHLVIAYNALAELSNAQQAEGNLAALTLEAGLTRLSETLDTSIATLGNYFDATEAERTNPEYLEKIVAEALPDLTAAETRPFNRALLAGAVALFVIVFAAARIAIYGGDFDEADVAVVGPLLLGVVAGIVGARVWARGGSTATTTRPVGEVIRPDEQPPEA